MKIAIALLALGATCAAPAAIAGDAKELLRDKIAFCSQFVINDPDSGILFDYMRDCCPYSRNLGECSMYGWGTIDKSMNAR
jgi:hypothetical protein